MPGRIILWTLVAAIMLWPPAAMAARFSGEYLIYVCASDKDGKEVVKGGHGVCQSYIAAVIDYHNLIHSLGTAPTVDFCVPENVGMNTLQKQVYAYMVKNKKEHTGFVAAPGVALALYAYYPCSGSKNR